jgi:hypothetical protein
MKTFAVVLAVLMCGYIVFMVSLVDKPTHWGVKNCELAEISPDFTLKEKQDCRIARKK